MLLVQDKQPITASQEYLAVMPIQHIRNDSTMLRELAGKYDIQAVVRSKDAVDNVKQYWQDHLDEFFQG